MTRDFFDCGLFFASPGVFPQPAVKTRANAVCPCATSPGVEQETGVRKQETKILAALRAGVYDSGFRVKPGMTRDFFDCGLFFASPGVYPQPAAKTRANAVRPRTTSPGVEQETDVRKQETKILAALRAGSLRFWIPGQARNDEGFLRLRPFLRFAGRVSTIRRKSKDE
ncbi:MAG: hypothetical protein LBS70_05010 [Candidatus Accumulibacter sp.]|jgi:hypothetical protein|nr:hypothetical protein [Accumulibacter sp.]